MTANLRGLAGVRSAGVDCWHLLNLSIEVRDMFALCAILLAPVPKEGGADLALTAKESIAVRMAVYDSDLTSTQGRDDPTPSVDVPRPLAELFKLKPGSVLRLLSRIADGARVEESFRAVCFAVALVDGGIAAHLLAETGKQVRPKYDESAKEGKKSPREHWVGQLSEMALKKSER